MSKDIDLKGAEYTCKETKLTSAQVASVLTLTYQEDCTVPFITRYRKEKTGGLDEEQIRLVLDTYEGFLEREKRRAFILETMKKMEVLTKELETKILKADTLNQLEDIYAPFKSKRKTKGQAAIDAGLAPLAALIDEGKNTIEQLAADANKWINPEKKFETWEKVLDGARYILIEKISHDIELKEQLRADYWRLAKITSSKRKDAETIKDWQKYKDYFEYSADVGKLKDPKAAHRFLAMRRGMTQKVLKVDVTFEKEIALSTIANRHVNSSSKNTEFLTLCCEKALANSIHPSLDLELKSELKKLSDESAIDVFKINLKNLLLQPYLGPKAVLALDPGVRTGCKLAVVDKTGKFLIDTVIYPFPPQNDKKGSKVVLDKLIEHYNVEYIAIGNGTFGRETLEFVDDNIEAVKKGKTKATLVNESGASIYSASPIAKKEFPDKDATVRGAISIARRFQDPLAELVKIDPKSIGVGQYQHDVNQIKLKKSLDGVVESCVNYVGVDLNTASAPLLSFISGIGPSLAGKVVEKREKIGGFQNRNQLLEVSRFSAKIFEQSAGFLRIYNGENPLDGTFIHPEVYPHLENWAKSNKVTMKNLVTDKENISKIEKDSVLVGEIGEFTYKDIIKALKAPAQDPRTGFKSTEFRKDIKTIKDLKEGELYTGIVTNITQFGAFVDIGIKQNGLVHVSQMSDSFVSNAMDVLKVGQEVRAKVMSIDFDRERIALTLKKGGDAEVDSSYSNKSKNQRKLPAQKEMKNNAFAGLSGFKVKS